MLNDIECEAIKFIADGSKTLGELYDKVGEEFGAGIYDECMAKGEVRSCIRNVCYRVAELLDGKPIKSFHECKAERVPPKEG